MGRYEPQERVWKTFRTWNEIKDYMDKVEKVIEIDGVSKVSIEFHDYKSETLLNWRISVDLVKN